MNTRMRIRSVIWYPSRGLFATASFFDLNAFVFFDDGSWRILDQWRGGQTWGLALARHNLVTVDSNQNLHMFDGKQHTAAPLSTDIPCFSVCALSEEELLVVGDTGSMWRYDLKSKMAQRTRLSELGIELPGRTILSARVLGERLYLLGRRSLLVELRPDLRRPRQLLTPGSSKDRSLSIWDIGVCHGELWTSALFGTAGWLARVEADRFWIPSDEPSLEGAPSVVVTGRDIWLGSAGVWVYEGTKVFRKVMEPRPADPVVALVRTELSEIAAVFVAGKVEFLKA